MRSEQEMLDLIVNTAKEDERIRAVIMNGSRVNPNAPKDFFQDFDIVYLVTEVAPFKHNLEWIKRFGEMMVMQLPDEMDDPPPGDPNLSDHFAYLMQFADGNRIDLSLVSVNRLAELEDDSLSLLLLDKDGIIKPFAPPSDSGYLPKPPTAKAYADCCNEFWWVSAYVAKGLWREEITYAKAIHDEYVRSQLMKMLTWYVGMRTQFTRGTGKEGKYLQQTLEPELWTLLLQTYADADLAHTWAALHATCDLFRIVARRVGEHFGFEYPAGDDERVSAHLHHVQRLPRDAKQMY